MSLSNEKSSMEIMLEGKRYNDERVEFWIDCLRDLKGRRDNEDLVAWIPNIEAVLTSVYCLKSGNFHFSEEHMQQAGPLLFEVLPMLANYARIAASIPISVEKRETAHTMRSALEYLMDPEGVYRKFPISCTNSSSKTLDKFLMEQLSETVNWTEYDNQFNAISSPESDYKSGLTEAVNRNENIENDFTTNSE